MPDETKELTKEQQKRVEAIVAEAIDDVSEVWLEQQADHGSIWITVMSSMKEVVEAVEQLDVLNIKGKDKKQIAENIIEAVIDKQDIKIKVLGVPVPGSKAIIKKYVMKYIGKLIDWLVTTLFNKKKNEKTNG